MRLFSNRSQRTSKCGNGNLETICELDYSELLRKCSEIEINISDREIEIVEQDTRTQAKGPGFLRYRNRNCGLLNVTPHYPIVSKRDRYVSLRSSLVCTVNPKLDLSGSGSRDNEISIAFHFHGLFILFGD